MPVFESTTNNFIPALWPIKTDDITQLKTAFSLYIADGKARLRHELTFLDGMAISELSNVVSLTQDALVLAADSELSRLLRGQGF